MLFNNQRSYDQNQEILNRLKRNIRESHAITHKRVTKDFDGVKDFKLSQFIETKFEEYGFGYPCTDIKILRCVGEEQALQTLTLYGGRNYEEAYFNKFRKQYDRSQHRVIEENILDGELHKAKQDKKTAYDSILKKHRDNLQEDFGFKRDKSLNYSNPWLVKNKKKPKIKGGGGNNDSSSDDDDDDDNEGKNRKKLIREYVKKQFDKYLIYEGKKDDDEDRPVVRQRLRIETPQQVFEKDAFKERPIIIDPATGNSQRGYDNLDSTFMHHQILDSNKNALAISSVDTLRASTSKDILRNNRSIRQQFTNFIDKKEDDRYDPFKTDQHGNPILSKSDENNEGDDFSSALTLGDVASSRQNVDGKQQLFAVDDEYDWDELSTTYERPDAVGNDDDEEFTSSGNGRSGGDFPPDGGSSGIRLKNTQEEYDSEGENIDDDGGGEGINLQQQSTSGGNDPPSGGSGGGTLNLKVGGVNKIVNMMDNQGYSEGQIQDFMENMSISADEFNKMRLDRRIGEISRTLETSDSLNGVDPLNSSINAQEREEIFREIHERKVTSKPFNLMSEAFKHTKSLNSLTKFSEKLSTKSSSSLTTQVETKIPERSIKSTDPGQTDDPYRSVFDELITSIGDDDDNDDNNVVSPIVGDPDRENRQNYYVDFDRKLNRFVGDTPIQQENAVRVKEFLSEIVKQDPKEIERQNRRKEEEINLIRSLKKNHNPNAVPTRDAQQYDHIASGGFTTNGPESRFETIILKDANEIDEQVFETTDENGAPSVVKAVESAISSITENEDATLGGFLGNTNGTMSLKDFVTEDYYKLVGVKSSREFQTILDKKMNADFEKSANEIEYSILTDSTKLNFLPNEPRPSSFPPISILPTDSEHKVIGAKPIFGGLPNEASQMLQGETPAKMISMEVDESLLITSEQAINVDTTVSDVNVVVEEHNETNYSARLRNLETFKDRAIHVVGLLLRDALTVGRIDQTMLQNKQVIMICQILTHAVSILLSRQSSYFEDFNARNLQLINVETVVDSTYPYFTLLFNGENVCSLVEISRNLFNFKMEAVTEAQFRSAVNEESPRLHIFKEFIYYILRENQIQNVDEHIVFRSETRHRQSTVIRYQNLDPQLRVKNFFIMLENYLLQLHVNRSTSIDDTLKFNNSLESDLHRRFSMVIFQFMAGLNAQMEVLITKSPFALLFTEAEDRVGNLRSLSYRRSIIAILKDQFSSSSSSDFNVDSSVWTMLFHSRDSEHYKGMLNQDLPPSGDTILRIIDLYRHNNYSTGTSSDGNQWSGLEPTKLIDILINAFIEHDVIPPFRGTYKRELGHFFAILTGDPFHYMFLKHLQPLYRRGWRKDTLATKAAFTLVENYVCLMLLIVQMALGKKNGQLSTTSSFVGNIGSISPMVKLQNVIKELIMTFDPIAYVADESANRQNHEANFKHHFKLYSEFVEEIIDSYSLWLQDKVDGYDFNDMMSREDLFSRIIAAGGYEESKDFYLQGIQTDVAESDEVTLENQPNLNADKFENRFDEHGEDMREIRITIKNTGAQTMSLPESNVTQPMAVKVDTNTEKTTVCVDASHPEVKGMEMNTLLKAVREVIKDELSLNIRNITEPVNNNFNSSSDVKSYVAFASDVSSGDNFESVISNNYQDTLLYNFSISNQVAPSDSASQTGVNDDLPLSLATFDYNAPSEIRAPGEVILTTGASPDAQLVSPSENKLSLLTIAEPEVITAFGNQVLQVTEDNDVLDLVTQENDIIGDDLTNRLQLIGSEAGSEVESTLNRLFMIDNDTAFGEDPEGTYTSELSKNKYSATKGLDETNEVIDELISSIGKFAEADVENTTVGGGKIKRKSSRIRKNENIKKQDRKLANQIRTPVKVAKQIEKDVKKEEADSKKVKTITIKQPKSIKTPKKEKVTISSVKRRKQKKVLLDPPPPKKNKLQETNKTTKKKG